MLAATPNRASRITLPHPAKLPSPQELEQAFSLFNEASAQLASAYQDLQDQVVRLTAELAVANGELRTQYEEKEALSRRLGLLLDALPGGVVVLDAAGRVLEGNPAALDLLGGDCVGRGWSQIEAQRLEGLREPRSPFLSPDGNWIGVFDEPNVLRKVTVNGGPAVTISGISGGPRGASWGPDDTIIFATNDLATGLFRVSASGGEAEMLTKPDTQKGELDHYWPEILPGGNAVLFTILSGAGTIQNTIAVLNLRTGERKILVPGGSYPRYVPTGHLVFGVEGALRAVAFDLDKLEVRSDSVPVLQRVVTSSSGAASFGVARNGSLVYITRDVQGGVERTLVWVDRQGREESLKAPP